MEEEHRRILREVCLQPLHKVSLIDFLRNPDNAASPAVELNLDRSRQVESPQAGLLMPFLLDTNILSDLRKGERCDSNVAAWAAKESGQSHYIRVPCKTNYRRSGGTSSSK